MTADRAAISRALNEIAGLLEANGASEHRVRAFRHAARVVSRYSGDLATAAESGGLERIRGIGEVTSRVIRELIEDGDSPYRERLVQGLAAAGQGADEVVRRPLLEVARPAAELLQAVRAAPHVERAEIAGALRRGVEVVGSVDLVVQLAPDHRVAGLEALRSLPRFGAALTHDDAMVVHLPDGLLARARIADPEAFGTTWVLATGSDRHVAGLRVRAGALETGNAANGDLPLGASEVEVYDRLGLPFFAPELRERTELVERAAAGGLPRLVGDADILGCVHCHTRYSDGKATVMEMAEAALAFGWRYLGIADHSNGARYARGMRPDALARQHDEIEAWNAERGDELYLLAGIEADIRLDGQLDLDAYSEEQRDRLDFVVASVHSRFDLGRDAMTARILTALDDPRVRVLGHPTGRRPLERAPYEVDLDAVFERAAERGVAVELNGHPRRLDLDWRILPRAVARGVTISIGPDAHSARALDHVELGVLMARKGELGPDDVLNTRSLDAIRKFFHRH